MSHKEKRIRKECVSENGPADPTSSSHATGENLGDGESGDDTNEFVTGVGYQIQKLGIVADA